MEWITAGNTIFLKNEVIGLAFRPASDDFTQFLTVYLRGGSVIELSGDAALKVWNEWNKSDGSNSSYETGVPYQ